MLPVTRSASYLSEKSDASGSSGKSVRRRQATLSMLRVRDIKQCGDGNDGAEEGITVDQHKLRLVRFGNAPMDFEGTIKAAKMAQNEAMFDRMHIDKVINQALNHSHNCKYRFQKLSTQIKSA